MRSWANLLVSTAKRRVKQLGSKSRHTALRAFGAASNSFLPAGATKHALDVSLVDITTARCLLLHAHNINTNNFQKSNSLSANEGHKLEQSKSSHGIASAEHFDYANALCIEACLLYAVNEIGSAHLEITMANIFNTLLSACEAFAAANRIQGKPNRAAYVNNWAMNLFRLSDVASRLERELTKGEVERAFPDSFIEHNSRDMFNSVREFLLNASLHVLKSANATDADDETTPIFDPSPRTQNTNNENAIRFIQREILNIAKPGNPMDRLRAKSRRKSQIRRKQSINEWKKRPGTPVTPRLRRDSRTMSVDTPVEQHEELLWTSRFVDYFTIVGRGKRLNPEVVPSTARDMEFSPVLMDQFPKPPGLKDMEVPAQLPDFCFPNGVRVIEKPVPPTYFHFVLTDFSGTALYVTCIHFYDKMDPIEVVDLFRSSGTKSPSNGDDASTALGDKWY